MKLLHLLPSVDPAGGGPLEGVRRRGLRLEELGHRVEVASLDDPTAPYLRSFGLTVTALGPGRGFYGYTPKLVPWLKANASSYDAIIVNGLWQYHALAALSALRGKIPYFVFTHGMLDPWFKTTYPLKHAKKWLYWPWADYRLLRNAQAVLFTSEEERRRAADSFWLYRAHEIVVPYGTTSPPNQKDSLREAFLNANPELKGKRLLLFLSRIHPKKGCDLLIRSFARFAAKHRDLHLVIAGPDQTGWVSSLQRLAQELGVEDRISWPGLLLGDLKWGAFYASEAFLLPSHQENFGIAVAEALGCGLPVLISNKVNIWREISIDRAGLVAPDTQEGSDDLLSRWLLLSATEQVDMSRCAKESFEKRYTIDAMAHGLIDVIRRNLPELAGPAIAV